MKRPFTVFELIEGECYTYNFPACPPSMPSIFLGYVRVSPQVDGPAYLAFQSVDEDGEVRFLNPSRMSAIRPDSW